MKKIRVTYRERQDLGSRLCGGTWMEARRNFKTAKGNVGLEELETAMVDEVRCQKCEGKGEAVGGGGNRDRGFSIWKEQ